MDLFLLRHGIAAERGTFKHDFERPLTAEGEKKLRRIAKAMRRLEPDLDLIISSPYVRARQTAEIVAAGLSARKKVQLLDSLGADGQARELIAELRNVQPVPGAVLLVGHEPYLSGLASLLVCGNAGAMIMLKKAGLCKMSLGRLKAGRCARLEWLLTPRQMLLMS